MKAFKAAAARLAAQRAKESMSTDDRIAQSLQEYMREWKADLDSRPQHAVNTTKGLEVCTLPVCCSWPLCSVVCLDECDQRVRVRPHVAPRRQVVEVHAAREVHRLELYAPTVNFSSPRVPSSRVECEAHIGECLTLVTCRCLSCSPFAYIVLFV